MRKTFTLMALAVSFLASAQIYTGSTNLGGTSTSLDITMNTSVDSVYMEFTGPSAGYYAVGFGSNSMNNTYTILVNSNGTVQEQKLGFWNGGSMLTSSISYSATTSAGMRTASIERGRVGISTDHYTFSPNGGSITLIWARGGSNFTNHGNGNRGVASINLVSQCNIPTTSLPTQSICAGDSIQVFGSWVSQAGTYVDSLQTAIGCDSLIEQVVQVSQPVTNVLSDLMVCQGDSAQVFNTWVSSNTTLFDTLLTADGCDSVLQQSVQVVQGDSTTVPDVGLCPGDSVFYLGAWRSGIGPVVETMQNMMGCDSVVSVAVTALPSVDTSSIWLAPFSDVSFYVGTDTLATYYWFNCNTGVFVDTTMGADTLNPGNEFLQAPDTGFYAAVIVRPGYCSDTSSCVYFYVSVDENSNEFVVAPNPASDVLRIQMSNFSGPVSYEVYSVNGSKVGEGIILELEHLLDVRSYSSGAYFIRTESGRTIRWFKN